jgi:hypothetical protein
MVHFIDKSKEISMCDHEFGEINESTLICKIKNLFCYVGSSDTRLYINKEIVTFTKTCEKCGFTEFIPNIKDINRPDKSLINYLRY